MLIETITSRQNPLIKRLVSVRDNYTRHLIFIEGINLVEEAIRANLHIETVVYSNRLFEQENGISLWNKLQDLQCRAALLPEKLLDTISSVSTPQGIILLASRPYYEMEEIFAKAPQLIILADGMQNPGNIGAMIRTAEAAGATGFITIFHTVDPYQPKSLRASAGSAFRFPILPHQSLDEILSEIRTRGIQLITASPRATVHFNQYNWQQPTALWLGSESHGLLNRGSYPPDTTLFIPMLGEIESLNITVASTILMYEAFRQRTNNWTTQ